MSIHSLVLGALLCGQAPVSVPAPPPVPTSSIPGAASAANPVGAAIGTPASPLTTPPNAYATGSGPISPEDVQDSAGFAAPPAAPVIATPNFAAATAIQQARGLFESDHAFDGFSTPLSNPVQSKDPRSLTEARFLFMGDFSRPSTPVVGGGAVQVYALQLRLALTERLQLFADKDGLAMVSPKGARSIFGMANIMAGAKYVFVRDVENQFLLSGAVQYEAPTGYPKIFEGHGNGLLGYYGIIGKQFGDNWHFVSTIGQNIALNNSNSGYFMWAAHLDRRFGWFVPFYEANWFYYNQSGNHVPGLGVEGGGWINIGSGNVIGLNYVTNAVGANFEFSQNVIFGVAYEYQLSTRTMLWNNMLNAQVIFRY